MKTTATAAVIIALLNPAFAEEPKKLYKQVPTLYPDNTTAFTVADGSKELQIITRDGQSASLKLKDQAVEDTGPKTWLGVVLSEVSPAVASQLPLDPGTGLIVEHVTPESPAAKAGLQKHDVMVRLGDQLLITPKQLQTLVANRKAGDTVEIAFLRKGQPQSVTAIVATHQPGDGLGDHKAAINLYDTKIDLDRLIKDASDTAGSIILNKKTVFVGPDGNPVTIDSDEIRDRTLKMLKESGLAREITEQVKRAMSEAQEQVRKAQEQVKQATEGTRKATEQRKEAAEQARKAMEQAERSAKDAQRR